MVVAHKNGQTGGGCDWHVSIRGVSSHWSVGWYIVYDHTDGLPSSGLSKSEARGMPQTPGLCTPGVSALSAQHVMADRVTVMHLDPVTPSPMYMWASLGPHTGPCLTYMDYT